MSSPMRASAFVFSVCVGSLALAQLPGGLGGGGSMIPGVDQIFRKGPAITTSLADCKFEVKDRDDFNPPCNDLFSLDRDADNAFVLREGGWEATVQSYCLKAGTHGPGGGDGYLFAPPKGPFENAVISIAQNSVSKADVPQNKIQVLLWALIARTKFMDLPRDLQALAAQLLTPKQISDINGGALGILTDSRLGGAILREPPLVRQVLEAENRLRRMLVNPASTFAEMEAVAVLTGEAPLGKGSREVPLSRWSLHPDGYFVRYQPSAYSVTKVQVYVPQSSKAVGKAFNPARHIAVPGNTSRQRLLMSGRKS